VIIKILNTIILNINLKKSEYQWKRSRIFYLFNTYWWISRFRRRNDRTI